MVLLKRYFCPRIKYKSGSSAEESTPPPLNLYADEPFAVTVKSTTGASSGSGKLVKFAPLIAGNAPESFDAVSVEILASATVPDAMFDPLRLVRFAPLAAGSVEGNLASGIVPDDNWLAARLVRFAPLPLNDPAVNKFVLGLYVKLVSVSAP